MKTLLVLAATAAVFAAGSTFAQGPSLLGDPALSLSNVSVGVEAGSTGYGVNFGYDVTPNTSLNIGWAGGSIPNIHGRTIDISHQDTPTTVGSYKVKTYRSQLDNAYAVIKYTPFTQQYLNWANVQFGTYIQDSAYRFSYQGVPAGKVSLGPSVNPYLGFGIAPKIDEHWGVNLDLGVIYSGKDYAQFNDGTPSTVLADRYRWEPLAKAGVSYHF